MSSSTLLAQFAGDYKAGLVDHLRAALTLLQYFVIE